MITDGDDEDDRQQREGVPLERVHQVVPEEGDATCTTTTMTRHSALGRWVRVFSANAPLTLFTANQPMPAVIAFSPAGSTLPQ